MAVLTRTIGQEVCDALGLSANTVTSLALKMNANELVSIEVTMLPSEREVLGVFEVLRRFELVERDNSLVSLYSEADVVDVTSLQDGAKRYAKIDANVSAAKALIERMAKRALRYT